MATQFQVGDRVRDTGGAEGVVLAVSGGGQAVSVRPDEDECGRFITYWSEDLMLVQEERGIVLGAVIEDMNDLRPGEWAVDRDGDYIERGERGFLVHYRSDISAGRFGGFPISSIARDWPEKYGPVRRCLKPRVLGDGSIWDGFTRPATEPPTSPWGENDVAGEAGEEIGRSILQGALAKVPIGVLDGTTIHGDTIRSVDQTTSYAPPEEPEPISDESEEVCFGTKETAADIRGADSKRLSTLPTPEPEFWFPSAAMLERADEERKRISKKPPTRARR